MSYGRSGRSGPSIHVQRALGWNGVAETVMRGEVAACSDCKADLRFVIGDYGQTLEICTNRRCPGHVPHAVRPDPAQVKAPFVSRRRKPRRS